MFGLSKRQRLVLDVITSLQDEKGWTPSYAEIAAKAGFKSKSQVYDAVRLLEDKGYLKRLPGRARSLQVIRGQGWNRMWEKSYWPDDNS